MTACSDCHVESIMLKPIDTVKLSKSTTAWLSVAGMGCEHCVTRVRNGLLGLNGVLRADVLLEEELAVVAYDPQETSPGNLLKAIRGAGNDGKHTYCATIKTIKPAGETWPLEQQLILRHLL